MKALLVFAQCIGCNSGLMSVTVFDSVSECDAARTALVQQAKFKNLWGEQLVFSNVENQPQCIPYVVPEIRP